MQQKKQVPQIIHATQISGDYGNQWAGKAMTFRYGGIRGVMQAVRDYPIRFYTDLFHPDLFHDVVNSANAVRVHGLNDLARIVNEAAKAGTLSESTAKHAIREADTLIYGVNERWLVEG